MTKFEIISTSLTVFNNIVIVFGIFIARNQLKLARDDLKSLNKIHSDNHRWNRALAAQEALRAFPYSDSQRRLQRTFNFQNSSSVIELKTIQQALESEVDLQSDLHDLLNFYESLARGIHQGVFDEDVIKSARMGAMIRAERAFKNYIIDRRSKTSPRAWCELSEIVGDWERQIANIVKKSPIG